MFTISGRTFNWRDAWRVRIFALGFLVIVLGAGSQVLVNAFASGTQTINVKVTAYASEGVMADGNWTYMGACAVAPAQFPFGTILALYNTDGSFNRQCTAEDSAGNLEYGHISLSMPGDMAGAAQWGVHYLLARLLRVGWGPGGPPRPSNSLALKAQSLGAFLVLAYTGAVSQASMRVTSVKSAIHGTYPFQSRCLAEKSWHMQQQQHR